MQKDLTQRRKGAEDAKLLFEILSLYLNDPCF